MKILLIGDASNYHSALASGLKKLGHDVTVASNGSRWMDTDRNIDLYRRPGKAGGAILWARLRTVLASRLKGYDVVQIVNPIFVDLRPHRVAALFRRLKRDNGAVYLTALGTETAYVEMCLAPDCPLRYTEMMVEGRPTPFLAGPDGPGINLWLRDPLLSHSRMIYDNVDGVVTALYEYHLAMQRVFPSERIAYGGIPVELDSIPFVAADGPDRSPLRVLLPYHAGREDEKGIGILHEIARSVPGIDLQMVTGLRFDEFRRRLANCDVVLDQYYSYTPATTALMAMAMGKIVVTGAEPEFERFVGSHVPAFNVDPFNHAALADFLRHAAAVKRDTGFLADNLFRTVSAPDGSTVRIPVGGEAARRFVCLNNDTEVVARRFVNLWSSGR